MSTRGVTVRGVLLCDDVRTEYNGKQIVIGVYGPKIGVPEFPAAVKFRLALLVDVPGGGSHEIKIRISTPNNTTKLEASIELQTLESGDNVLIPGFDFALKLDRPGILRAEHEGEGWKTIGSWPVSIVTADEIPISPNSFEAPDRPRAPIS